MMALYGLVWGTAFGQLFLSFWHIAAMLGPDWATWQVWLLTYAWLSIWQWLLSWAMPSRVIPIS